MGNPKAFLEIHRQEAGYRPIHDRIHDFGEVEQTATKPQSGTMPCIKAIGSWHIAY